MNRDRQVALRIQFSAAVMVIAVRGYSEDLDQVGLFFIGERDARGERDDLPLLKFTPPGSGTDINCLALGGLLIYLKSQNDSPQFGRRIRCVKP